MTREAPGAIPHRFVCNSTAYKTKGCSAKHQLKNLFSPGYSPLTTHRCKCKKSTSAIMISAMQLNFVTLSKKWWTLMIGLGNLKMKKQFEFNVFPHFLGEWVSRCMLSGDPPMHNDLVNRLCAATVLCELFSLRLTPKECYICFLNQSQVSIGKRFRPLCKDASLSLSMCPWDQGRSR